MLRKQPRSIFFDLNIDMMAVECVVCLVVFESLPVRFSSTFEAGKAKSLAVRGTKLWAWRDLTPRIQGLQLALLVTCS
jgi:hypothetical protein